MNREPNQNGNDTDYEMSNMSTLNEDLLRFLFSHLKIALG
jgi:hypothetical protein